MHNPLSCCRHWLAAATSFVAIGLASPAHAAWPDRPLKIVVPSSPGGGADTVARLLGDRLSRAIGQPVIIDNKGGGGGNIATEFVAKAAPDGYTVLFTGNNHTVNVSLPSVVDTVAGRIAVLIDSGFRSGADIAKAIALGADAVQLGRPTLYGLAAGGEVGVRHALRMLRDEFDRSMGLCGATCVAGLRGRALVPATTMGGRRG